MVARGYVIPGGASQRGGGQAPMFQCRTLSDTVRVRLEGLGWVPLGRARRVLSGQIGFRRVSVGTLFWHDGTRRGSTGRSIVPRIGARLMYGPLRRHRRTPFNRRLPGLGGSQLLSAQAGALVV